VPYVAPPSIPLSTVTTKGDLVVATASGIVTRRAVGSNTQVLTADSAQTDGVKWAAAAGGGTSPGIGTGGKWFRPPSDISGPNSTLNQLHVFPLWIPQAVTLDRIAVQISGSVATATTRLGLYSPDASGGFPGTLLLDAGTVDTSTAGLKAITISQALSAGIIYVAVVNQTAAATLVGRQAPYSPMLGFSEPEATPTAGPQNGWYKSGVTGALPASFSYDGAATNVPTVWVRVV
jgi:hypothetical protein